MKRAPAPVLALLALALVAATRPQTTPLEGEQLFISPSGQPFRSASGQPYPVVQWFKAADTNHDGKLDRTEFRADAQTFFAVLDRNGDGVITDPEIAVYEKTMAPEILTGTDPSGTEMTKLSSLPQGAAGWGLINDAEPVRSADQGLTGRITLKMFLVRADQNFDTLDQDGRGYLTLEDLPRTPAQKLARVARPSR